MAGCCGKTSVLLKTAAFLTLLAFVLLLLGFATPLWSSRTGSNEGLWEECIGNTCASVIGTALGGQAWFIAVQVLVTIALVAGFGALVVTFVIMFDAACGMSKILRIVAIVHEFVTAALLLISVIVYWIKGSIFYTDFFLNFSWGITVAALIVFVIGGILLSVDIDQLHNGEEEEADSTPDSVTSEVPSTGESSTPSTPDQ